MSERAGQQPGSYVQFMVATKLHVPPQRQPAVPRPHLMEQIQRGAKQVLTLLSAPAGFGKTTLLAQWCAESTLPVAWLSLETADNEAARFLSYLIAALQTLSPRIGKSALTLLPALSSTPLETILTLLTNDLASQEVGDFILVLDDYHHITAEPIHRAIAFLLEHQPPQMHFVIATRADPPLPLARLRARGQLTELRTADLRFAATEADVFLHTVMGLELTPQNVAALHRRTEGWVTGLQLAALSLRDRTNTARFLTAFTGSHRFILDYLTEEVFTRQPPAVQLFLLHTCILERLCSQLCDAITEQRESQHMLEMLEKANLFVIALDDERAWYRYHHLFADVLRNHLRQSSPALIPELHRRASLWYQEHGLIVDAIQHALAAPDFVYAANLLEKHAQTIAMAGQISLVLGWLNVLPTALVRTRPLLCIYLADLLMHTRQLEKVESCLQDAERCLQADTPAQQTGIIRGGVAHIRALIARASGDLSRALSLAQQALEELSETEHLWRASAGLHLAQISWLSGDVTPATEQLLRAARTSALVSGDFFLIFSSGSLLGRVQILQGRLREATATYEMAVQALPEPDILPALSSALFYFSGMGNLLREQNDLDAAEKHLTASMDLVGGTQMVSADEVTYSYLALVRLHLARGDYHKAMATLETFGHLAQQRRYIPRLVMQGTAMQAQVELARGNLAAALRWAESSGLSINDEVSYPYERAYLALARVYIAQGRSDPAGTFLQDALYLLGRFLEDAEARARLDSVLEILVLQALALHAQGERTQALSLLERALLWAVPQGYVRLFVDEGVPMLHLLRLAHRRGIAPGYVATLLATFSETTGEHSSVPSSAAGALLEPLTERELEVLSLLAAGASNSAIAQRLVVSLGTVKKHVSNICGKLGVQSRTQAIARAHDLHLL